MLPPDILARKKQPFRAPDALSFVGPHAPGWVAERLSEAALAEAGVFDPGAVPITGTVTGPGGTPQEGVLIALLTAGFEDMRLWDVARTDANGAYAVGGKGGLYMVMALSPRATTYASGGALVNVTGAPIVQDIAVGPGVPVTGQVVCAADGTTPVPNALVSFAGNGHDQAISGADGRFGVYVPPGNQQFEVAPPHGARFRHLEQELGFVPPL